LDHFWQGVHSGWMVRIVVSDHLAIAGLVLIGLWLDAARRKWCLKSQLWQGRGVRGQGSTLLAISPDGSET
jgi:hypothetical protein